MSSSNNTALNTAWFGILILTLIGFVSLIISMVQNEIPFFQFDEWQNFGGRDVSILRAYFVAIYTMLISFAVATYGFWRPCLKSSKRKTLDIVFSGAASAAGSLVSACMILFLSFNDIAQEFAEGEGSVFVFGLSCLMMTVLYAIIDLVTIRQGTKANPAVDSSSLL